MFVSLQFIFKGVCEVKHLSQTDINFAEIHIYKHIMIIIACFGDRTSERKLCSISDKPLDDVLHAHADTRTHTTRAHAHRQKEQQPQSVQLVLIQFLSVFVQTEPSIQPCTRTTQEVTNTNKRVSRGRGV